MLLLVRVKMLTMRHLLSTFHKNASSLDLPEDEEEDDDAAAVVERSAWHRHPPFEG